MSVAKPRILELAPIVSYPREAAPGEVYFMSVDVQPSLAGDDWPFAREEYPIRCLLDTYPLFSFEEVGEPEIVVHRFGGTYGPARFVLTANQSPMEGSIRISLVSDGGVLITTLTLDHIRITAERIEPPQRDPAAPSPVAFEPPSVPAYEDVAALGAAPTETEPYEPHEQFQEPDELDEEPVPAPPLTAAETVPLRVFISYSHTDDAFASMLANRLVAAGIETSHHSFDTFYDAVSLRPGESWWAEIRDDITASNVFLVILSPASVTSRWVENELDFAWANNKVIIPVLAAPADIPRLLTTRPYVSFLRRDQDEAFAELLHAIRSNPPFDFAVLPRIDHFIGREREAESVLELLAPAHEKGQDVGGDRPGAVVALTGIGGIGKTALATEVIHRLVARNAFPDGIVVIRCGEQTAASAILRQILRRFDPRRRQPAEHFTFAQLLDVAGPQLQGKHALVVLDNVEQETPIEQVVHSLRAFGLSVLLTTRHHSPFPGEYTIILDSLSESNALALFTQAAGYTNDRPLNRRDRAAAQRIMAFLTYNPLAIVVTADQIPDNIIAHDLPLAAFADELQTNPPPWLRQILEEIGVVNETVLASRDRRDDASALVVHQPSFDRRDRLEHPYCEDESAHSAPTYQRILDHAYALKNEGRIGAVYALLTRNAHLTRTLFQEVRTQYLLGEYYMAAERDFDRRAVPEHPQMRDSFSGTPFEPDFLGMAADAYARGAHIARDIPDSALFAQLKSLESRACYSSHPRHKRYRRAFEAAREALNTWTRLPDRDLTADIVYGFQLGDILGICGIAVAEDAQAGRGLEYAEVRLLDLQGRPDSDAAQQASNELFLDWDWVTYYFSIGQYRQAFKMALDIRRRDIELLIPRNRVRFQTLIANIMLECAEDARLGDYSRRRLASASENAIQNAYEWARDLEYPAEYAQILLAEAKWMGLWGVVENRAAKIVEAQRIATTLDDVVLLGQVNIAWGDEYAVLGNRRRSRRSYQQAERDMAAIGLLSLARTARRRLDRLDRNKRAPRTAKPPQATASDSTFSIQDWLQSEPPTALPIFISHSSKDNAFCSQLVNALRDAGADVWFDEDNLRPGGVTPGAIQRQLGRYKIFIVILSKDAFASGWVQGECEWAYQLYREDRMRIILPVTAGPIERDDFLSLGSNGQFLYGFKRVEGANFQPLAPDEAIRRVMHMLALTPKGEPEAPVAPQPDEDANDLIIRGIALRGQKQFDDARHLFERAVQRDPASATAWFNVGYSRDAVGDIRGALAAWERTVQLEPHNATAWINKGNTLLKVQQYQEALEAFETALRIKETYVFAWHGKGIALKELGRAEEAIEAYDRALTLDPRFAYAWNGKGSALLSLHQLDKALEAFDAALRNTPQLALVWRNKASVLIEMQRYQEALEAADKAIDIAPTSSTGWQRKEAALRGLGRFHDAEMAQAQVNRFRGSDH